jgi:hypothetical protein
MTILKSACVFFLSVAAAICADTGSISGKIVTAARAGIAVPGAPVQAKNLDTQATYKATSASDGSYNLSGLAPGAYEILVEDEPFQPFHQSGVQVVAGKTTRLDIRLDSFALSGSGAITAQLAPSGPTPRASDGKPDLSGVWLANALPSLVGEAPDPLPETEAIFKKGLGGLGVKCLPDRTGSLEYQLVQTSGLIVIVDGGWNPTRLIYLDGRGHPRDFNPSWMGHSIGHWEADTLVVETAGFNDLGRIGGPVDGFAQTFPRTQKLRVTERFRRPDLGHLEVERIYDDPGTFKKPFTTRYVRKLAPTDWEILEYVCNENEKDAAHMKFDQ